MFAGSILDTCTTWVVIARHYGVEMNPILGPLIRHSFIWIPVYLLSHPLLVLLVPKICRPAFAVYFGLTGLLFGANNLSGILYRRYFLMETFGFRVPHVAFALIATTVFFWTLWKRFRPARERKQQILIALCWIGIFVLLELGFFAMGKLLFR